MKLSFRWYGAEDPVTLEYIRQIPAMHSIVTAVYDVPPGSVWSVESIGALKSRVEAAGLRFEVIESVPVHEDIKMGLPTRRRYVENYCENIRRLAKAGVKCICYNFMPVFDWTRTNLAQQLPDGSNALVFYPEEAARMAPLSGELALPGWDQSYKKDELQRLFDGYAKLGVEALWDNLHYFLQNIIPVAHECGVNMAIHPDDPPCDIFGLPRIITCEQSLDRLLDMVNVENNGLTLCTGSLGSGSFNDVIRMAAKYAARSRVYFVHARNVKLLPNGGFEESAHYSPAGSLDMVGILNALHTNGFDGYMRPDHGRMIWGEQGKPGYGLYDRALGASYLTGIWETLEKTGAKA